MSNNRGFTLLEVLVAMAVLALSVAALIKQSGAGIRQAKLLEDKHAAAMIAETELNKLLLLTDFSALNSSQYTVEKSDQKWLVEVDITSTARSDMKRIEILVGSDDSGQGSIGSVRLVAFKGQH